MQASVVFRTKREWFDFGIVVLRLGLAVLMLFAGVTKFVGTLPTETFGLHTGWNLRKRG